MKHPPASPVAAALLSFVFMLPALAADDGIRQRMQQQIDRKEVAGTVTIVVSRDKVLDLQAVGQADVAAGTPMKPDTIFWIASMTKPVTATAVMMLQEDGKLSVEDPVGKFVPELKDLKTKEGKPANLTLRHLLTHTSGMGEATGEQSKKAEKLADLIPVYASQPVKFEPGNKWEYCQSGINTLGRIVEVVSGQPFQDFLQERLFTPLGMKDTTFYLSAEQVSRLARSYARTGDKLNEAPIFILDGHAPNSRQRYPAANGGLFSTAPDYGRFCQMILNDGQLDGKRYLKPESVKQLCSVQTPDSITTGFTPGNGWGLGWCVVRQPQGVSEKLSPGSFGHGGAYGTQAWIDPVRGVAYVLMTQRANFPNSDASDLRKQFQDAASALASK
jgi:CubicO group peptidase (beta-lactamase class C family)